VAVAVGGSATTDGGAGALEALDDAKVDVPLTVICDVRTAWEDAPRVFGPQKGADADAVEELELRLGMLDELADYRNLPGAGAGGGLGAAFAAMGAELVAGAELVLDLTRFDERAQGAALVVTGEGIVDTTTFEGKAPGAVLRRCETLGVRCELFGGIVRAGFTAHALSGRRALAGEDLVQLGEERALTLTRG
jgi:glycerate kinase